MTGFLNRLLTGGILFFSLISASQASLKIQEVTSSHGIKAWLVEDHTIPVISLRMSFKAGASYVPAEKAGLVEVLSHMLDEGAGTLNSREFNEKLQKLAIDLSFECDSDEFKIFLKTTKNHHQEAFDLLKLALTQPRFDAREFEKIRSAIISSLKVQEKTPDYLVAKTFKEVLMANHPYGRLRMGTEETLKKLTPHDLKAFIQKAFAKDALTIGVCGDITPQELKKTLDHMFGDLPDQSSLPQIPPFEHSWDGETKIIQTNFPQSRALFVQKGLSARDPEYIYMVLLNQILGGTPTSRLFSQVRAREGYVYTISTSSKNYDRAYFFLGELGSANRHVLPALKLIQEIWSQVKEKGVTQAELEEAKSYVAGSFVLNLTSSGSIAELIHYYQRWGYPMDYPQKRDKLIKSVTLDQLNKFAEKFLDPQGLSFIIVGKPEAQN